jgi:hypothetical protein
MKRPNSGKLAACTRCGAVCNIEKHHIKHRANGGRDAPENLKDLCTACHDYQHAKENIIGGIELYENKLRILRHRLEVLESLNQPELIKVNGYQSYWKDATTHDGSGFNFVEAPNESK